MSHKSCQNISQHVASTDSVERLGRLISSNIKNTIEVRYHNSAKSNIAYKIWIGLKYSKESIKIFYVIISVIDINQPPNI